MKAPGSDQGVDKGDGQAGGVWPHLPGLIRAPVPSDSMGRLLTRADVDALLERCSTEPNHPDNQEGMAEPHLSLMTMCAEIDRLNALLKEATYQASAWQDKAMQLQGDVEQLRNDNKSLLERQEKLRTAARLGIGTLEMVGSNLSVANVLRNGLRY